jgi:steroid delta-isomerase
MEKEDFERRLTEYMDSIRSMETDRWVGEFAENATVEDPVGTPEVRGHEQLRGFFDGVRKRLKLLDLTPEFVVVSASEAAVKWSAVSTAHNGLKASFPGVTAFKLREDGKILQLRAFWDAKEVARQFAAAKALAQK